MADKVDYSVGTGTKGLRRAYDLARIATLVLMMVMAASSFLRADNPKFVHHSPKTISATETAKAKFSLRIIENAAEAELLDGKFDPFTAGLLDGVEKDLEEDSSYGHLSDGDRDINTMLDLAELWMVQYRVGPIAHKSVSTDVMHWFHDCVSEIRTALRNGASTGYGACNYTEEKYKAINGKSSGVK